MRSGNKLLLTTCAPRRTSLRRVDSIAFGALMLSAVLALTACGGGGGATRDAGSIVTEDGQVVTPGSYEDSFEQQQRLPGSTFVEITEVRAREDGLVFFCSGVRGLNVVDASDPKHMDRKWQLVSSLGSLSYPKCQHMAWSGDLLYVSNRGDELSPVPFLAVFDLAQSPPKEIGNFTDKGITVEGVAANGDLLFAAMHETGLGIFRLDRAAGKLVKIAAATGLTNAWGVAVDGNYAYVADGVGGMVVVDVTDPANPVVGARVETGGAAQSVELDRKTHTAYVAAGQAGMVIVDITDPTLPAVVGAADTPGTTLQIAIDNGHAYVADWNDVRVFDISDRTKPVLITTERIESGDDFSRVLGIAAFNDHAYLGEWTGLYSYELQDNREAPDLWLGDRSLEFGSVAAGDADAIALILQNQGSKRLVIWSIESDNAAFTLDQTQVVIPAGGVAVVEVVYRPTDDTFTRGTLQLFSDDPDESVRTLEIAGNRPGTGLGDTVSDVKMQLLGGGEWNLSDHKGEVVLLSYFATF